MWYATILLCITATWQTIVMLASVVMVYERSRAPVNRFSPWKGLACNIVVLINVFAVYVFLGLSGDGPLENLIGCQGFHLWLFGLMPRFVWFSFLTYDLTFLLVSSGTRSSLRKLSIALTLVYTAISFIGTTIIDSTFDYQHDTGVCYTTSTTELIICGLTALAWLMPTLITCLPRRELFNELFHLRVSRMSGCDLSLLFIGWCAVSRVPRNFTELDALTAERVRTHKRQRNAIEFNQFDSYGDPLHEPGVDLVIQIITQDDDDEHAAINPIEAVMLKSDHSLASLPVLAPLVPHESIVEILHYDPCTRRVCLIEIVLALLMFVFLTHIGRWSFHPAWRCASYVLYCTPFIYWQFWRTLRPAFYTVVRDTTFEYAHKTLEQVEQMVVRAECARYDYAADLKYYVQTSSNAQHCQAKRVDAFLRTINLETNRDHFREFRLWVMCMQRREEYDPLRRVAMAQHIMEMFFYPSAPLFVQLDPRLFTVLMAGGYTLDDVHMFDECITSLAYDLDQRTDREQIMDGLRMMWQQQEEQSRLARLESLHTAQLAAHFAGLDD